MNRLKGLRARLLWGTTNRGRIPWMLILVLGLLQVPFLVSGCGLARNLKEYVEEKVFGQDRREPIYRGSPIQGKGVSVGGVDGDMLDGDSPGDPPLEEWVDEGGLTHSVIGGVVLISFIDPPVLPVNGQEEPIGDINWLQNPEIQQFISETGITVLSDWPALKLLYAGLPEGMTVQQAIEVYESLYPDLVYDVSPDVLVDLQDTTPNDTDWSDPPGWPWRFWYGQYALKSSAFQGGEFGIRASRAWDRTHGSDFVVTVIDTGVSRNHPDLYSGRIHPYGVNVRYEKNSKWNFAKSRLSLGGGTPNISYEEDPTIAHGTAVAGIIGAMTNNNRGIAAVDWNCPVFSVEVDEMVRPMTFAWNTFIEAIYVVGVLRGRYTFDSNRLETSNGFGYVDSRVVNMSWGRLMGTDPTREEKKVWGKNGRIAKAIADISASGTGFHFQKGTVFVGAAGNYNFELREGLPWRHPPATLDNVVSVAAVGLP